MKINPDAFRATGKCTTPEVPNHPPDIPSWSYGDPRRDPVFMREGFSCQPPTVAGVADPGARTGRRSDFQVSGLRFQVSARVYVLPSHPPRGMESTPYPLRSLRSLRLNHRLPCPRPGVPGNCSMSIVQCSSFIDRSGTGPMKT